MAAVLGPREAVLNIGSAAGVAPGDRFEILDPGIPITFEGELLGTYARSPVQVRAIEVQERLAVVRPLQERAATPALPSWVAVGGRARRIEEGGR